MKSTTAIFWTVYKTPETHRGAESSFIQPSQGSRYCITHKDYSTILQADYVYLLKKFYANVQFQKAAP